MLRYETDLRDKGQRSTVEILILYDANNSLSMDYASSQLVLHITFVICVCQV